MYNGYEQQVTGRYTFSVGYTTMSLTIKMSGRSVQMTPFSTELRLPSENKIMNVVKLRWRGLLFVAAVASLGFLLYYTVRGPKYGYDCHGPYWEERTLQHLQRYCNPVSAEITGKEGAVPHDGTYQLQSVHVLIRHGDRYNMHSLPNYDNQKVSCLLSDDLQNDFPVMKSYLKSMEKLSSQEGRSSQQTFHAYNLYPNKDVCGVAQLTPTGATQHVLNGKFLKTAYLDGWKLLDAGKVWDQVMVRSTTKSRTFQSALALMFGFLPELDVAKLQIEEATNNSMCTGKSGLSCQCDGVAEGLDVFSCNFLQRSPHVMAQPKIRDAYAQLADVLGVASNNLPPPSHIMDVNMIHFCHHLLLPSRYRQCMQPWTMANIYDEVNVNGENQVKNPTLQRIVKLKLQPLMYEIAHRMKRQLDGDSALKFVLYSGHDSTIEPFATAMGFSTGVWSRYAARINLELYSDTKKNGFIRVLFDGEIVTESVSFCKDHIVDMKLGLCPLAEFLNFVESGNMKDLNANSYNEACKKFVPMR